MNFRPQGPGIGRRTTPAPRTYSEPTRNGNSGRTVSAPKVSGPGSGRTYSEPRRENRLLRQARISEVEILEAGRATSSISMEQIEHLRGEKDSEPLVESEQNNIAPTEDRRPHDGEEAQLDQTPRVDELKAERTQKHIALKEKWRGVYNEMRSLNKEIQKVLAFAKSHPLFCDSKLKHRLIVEGFFFDRISEFSEWKEDEQMRSIHHLETKTLSNVEMDLTTRQKHIQTACAELQELAGMSPLEAVHELEKQTDRLWKQERNERNHELIEIARTKSMCLQVCSEDIERFKITVGLLLKHLKEYGSLLKKLHCYEMREFDCFDKVSFLRARQRDTIEEWLDQLAARGDVLDIGDEEMEQNEWDADNARRDIEIPTSYISDVIINGESLEDRLNGTKPCLVGRDRIFESNYPGVYATCRSVLDRLKTERAEIITKRRQRLGELNELLGDESEKESIGKGGPEAKGEPDEKRDVVKIPE